MKTKFLAVLTPALAITITSIVATTGVARADILEFTTEYKPSVDDAAPYAGYGVTDIFKAPLSIQKFKPSWGILNSVKIDFVGDLTGDAGFESRDAKPRTITVDLSGLLQLQTTGGTSIFELDPKQSYKYDVTKFDGILDFAGTSGRTLEGLTTSASGTKTYTDSSFLQSFIGNNNLDFLFTANAKSTVQGSGNITSYVNTYAKASVKVTYDYRKRVPEPSLLLGVGLVGGAGLWSKRNRNFSKA
ncbi:MULTISPECIES: choice-of-anchor E domain-containing protein [Nostocales]|uniref:Choice-of-anchor E domain-containing protein n=3 Tax=Nostocales TaxID=1161 RepID=A0A0C1N605_9CYAN|nr:choice-of-anchor E domain-containing protein [Tolypothrix bouteillei]KAF3885986.1 choice-of-anchor E domain-containing protein [Tolypothrix bouteillei VB521301]